MDCNGGCPIELAHLQQATATDDVFTGEIRFNPNTFHGWEVETALGTFRRV